MHTCTKGKEEKELGRSRDGSCIMFVKINNKISFIWYFIEILNLGW